ncbi:uncharacterized protein LOC132816157 isoform X1 [Hemiscyllium ocellatum]|uniref:uncharacterized protein LOC132816157 isoform X1 n=1 Tax=Hemiscyllium ocellatum TaxID=170820 RepID=UPI0029661B2D|nr:uncharacterized protein LOC132816157 isoform X1 [Hemiscyllium ocellatum]
MNSPVEVQKYPCLGNQVPVTSPCSPQSRGWPLKTSPPPPLRKRARMSQRKCRPGCLLQPSLSSDADTSMGSGSEIDGGDEDKEIASKAVALVIRSSRKGVVPLCADVANLLKIKWRLERTIKAQQLEIHRLLSMSRTHCSQSSASTQTNFSGPGSPVPSSSDRSASQTAELIRCEEQQQFELRVSPRQSDQEALVQCVSPPQNVESLQKPVPGCEFTVSRGEVQVECPQLLMQKRCEQELMETLLLNSRLTEDLGGAWNQIEHLRDRLRQSEKQEPQETLSMENVYHGQGTRSREDSKLQDREPIPTACRCANQDTVLTNCREDGHSGQQTNRTDKGTLRKHSVSCTLPTKEGQLQSTSHVDTPKARRPDFQVDASLSCSIFPFPLVGCQCSSCISFFGNYKLTNGRNGHEKDKIKTLLHLQRQKLPIDINDYVIVNGNKSGTARYVGHLDGSGMANAVFVGVELDEPSGQHNGTFAGKRYFQCYENFAIFVPVHEIFYVINRKPKKSISPPRPSSLQHCHSLGSLSNNPRARGEHSHQATSRRKQQHLPKNLHSNRRVLRKSGVSTSLGTSVTSVNPTQEEWSDSNERTEKVAVSSLQSKLSNRTSTITASLPPDIPHYRSVHAPNRVTPRKVSRR